jgi:hypothetical protein
MEIYKLIARNKATKRQYKKWQYIGKDNFGKYSPDIIKRYAVNDCYYGYPTPSSYTVEVYKMIDNKWEMIAEYNRDKVCGNIL